MKTIKLKLAERIQLISFLNGLQGKNFETLTHVWKLIDKVAVNEEEKREVEFRIEGNSFMWNQDKAQDKEVSFSLEEEKMFIDDFEAKSKKEELGADIYNLAQVYIRLKDTPKDE